MSYIAAEEVITVEGSVSVKVGNERKSIPYSQKVKIKIRVDNDAFDRSIKNANNTINRLTGSVSSMNADQCSAIEVSASNISNAVSGGFNRLIGSEISTQIAENKSALEASANLVIQLSKEIVSKHQRMLGDINRLKRHYATIFEGLDKDLQTRILSLDQKSFELSKERNELVIEPYLKNGSFSMLETGENASSQSLLTSARLKSKASSIINVISGSVSESSNYANNIKNITCNESVVENKEIYIPVIIYKENRETDDFIAVSNETVKSGDKIREQASHYGERLQENKWQEISEDDSRKLNQYFNSFVEKELGEDLSNEDSVYKKRVYDEIKKMWESNSLKILNN